MIAIFIIKKFFHRAIQQNTRIVALLTQLDDVRTTQAPPFDEVKPQLQQRLQQQKVEKQVLDLRAKAKVD